MDRRLTADMRPYRDLSLIYDEIIGATAFECWKGNFKRLVNRYSISFDVSADIACGTGLAAAYLSGFSSRVYATDISPQMIAVARGNVIAANVVFLEQSFAELELPEPVDLLTCNFDSLNYLVREEDLKEALRRFGSSVRPGGYCVFDMNTTREFESGLGDFVMVHKLREGMSIWESCWDASMRINTLRMTNFVGIEDDLYRMSEEVHRERSYDIALIQGFLRAAGFSLVEASDARDLSRISRDTRRVQFLARR